MGAHLESFKFHSVYFFNGKNWILYYIKGYAPAAVFKGPQLVPLVATTYPSIASAYSLRRYIDYIYVSSYTHIQQRVQTTVGEYWKLLAALMPPLTAAPPSMSCRPVYLVLIATGRSLGRGDRSVRLKVDPPRPIFN